MNFRLVLLNKLIPYKNTGPFILKAASGVFFGKYGSRFRDKRADVFIGLNPSSPGLT